MTTKQISPQTIAEFDEILRCSFKEVQKDIAVLQNTNKLLLYKIMSLEHRMKNSADELVTRDEFEEALDMLKNTVIVTDRKAQGISKLKDLFVNFFSEDIGDFPVETPKPR